jgi:hypothetical protein
MAIIPMIFLLVILGVALYLIETYIPMSPPIKIVIRVLVVLLLVYLLLGMLGYVKMPRLT